MTQNKKKGVAKKALSISLVAAMLATSNVPVWASFEAVDETGFAVEEIAPEAVQEEAPIAEDTELTKAIINQGDLNIDLSITEDSVEWGTSFHITGSIMKTDGTAYNSVNYGVRIKGEEEALVSGSLTGRNGAFSQTIATTDKMAGKTLEFYIYRDDVTALVEPVVIDEISIEKKTLTAIDFTGAFSYTGFTQSATAERNVTVKSGSATIPPQYYTFNSTSGKNAGDVITVSATAKSDSPYEGTVTDAVTIAAKDYASGDIIASVNDGVTYEYTGNTIEMSSNDVTVVESKSDNNGVDGKLSGADLSAAIMSVVSTNGRVGDQTANVTLDASKLVNFKRGSSTGSLAVPGRIVTVDGKVTIKPRDLATTDIIVGSNNKVSTGTAVSSLPLTFKANGVTLNLSSTSDYTIVVKNASGQNVTSTISEEGDYTVEITAKGNNTENAKTVSFRVEGNVITDMAGSKFSNFNPEYTGVEITPSKEDIGTLTVKGSAGNKTLQSDEWEIIGYTNNINAATYTGTVANPQVKTQAYVNIKILAGTYKDKTFAMPFIIAPLTVTSADIKVPKTVTYDKSIVKAEDYQIPVQVIAKDSTGKKTVELKAEDFSVKYSYINKAGSSTSAATNELKDHIRATVTITNTNFILGSTSSLSSKVVVATDTTEISAAALADLMIKVNPVSYVYTGGAITPEYTVMDGSLILEKDLDFVELSITDAVNVGTGTITIKGLHPYYSESGSAQATFTITPADIKGVKIEIDDQPYTGQQIRPRNNSYKITLNGNDVTDQFEIASYGTNKVAGKAAGTVTFKTVKGNTNFTGDSVTGTFDIVQEKVSGAIKVYDKYGIEITNKYNATTGAHTESFTFDGTAKTFASAKLVSLVKAGTTDATKATADEFELKYVDNVVGKTVSGKTYNIAYIYAIAKDTSNYSGADTITTADGTVIKGVVAKMPFAINSVKFVAQNVTVNNGVYAGGLPVKPQILVQIGGNTLVEGTDYVLMNYPTVTDVTNGKIYDITVKGINGYANSNVTLTNAWGIDKKNLNDCDVTIKNGVVTVTNGSVTVPTNEYTVLNNADGSITIIAASNSKNYSGSKTIANATTAAPASTTLRVTDRTTSTVSLAWNEVAGAEGYTIWFRSEYDTKVSRKIIQSGDVTSWTQNGLQPGTKYFYTVKAWVKDSEGKYVFGEQSPVQRGTTKPIAAQIKSVSATNGNVKVVLAGKAAGAEMYSMCYSKSADFDNFAVGIRTSYTTRTFSKTLAKGTYFVRVKSYRDLGNNKRVYGAWSNTMTVVVK